MHNKDIIFRLVAFIWTSPLLFIISCISAILSVLLNLCAPIIIGQIIDFVTSTKSMSEILPKLFLLIVIYLLYSLFSWAMMYTSNRIAFSSSSTLRKQVHDKMDHLPISYFDTHQRGDLISRYINDIDIISDGLLQGLSTMISGVVTILAALLFMLCISWQMSIVVILSAPFTFFIARTITIRSQKHFRKQAKTLGTLNGYTEEIITQIKTVKAYHYEDHAITNFKNINDSLYHSGVTSQFYGSLANPSTRFVMNIAYSIVGVCGAIMCLADIISIGNISTFLIYSNIFSKPFNEITGIMTQLQSAIASGQRIFTLFDEQEEVDTKNNFDTPVVGNINFSHVAFSYEKDKPLMQDVNVSVKAGQTIAIVGTTGAGKTTLVNLLMRFYDIDQGCITLEGIDIHTISRDSLRKQFGMVLQDTYLFEGSISANIAYGKPNATKDEIMHAAKKSGAHEFIRRLNNGYNTILHANSSMLSQGQRQLLSITRIILMNPSILILDEATSNIDTRSEQHITKAIQLLMQGKTSFIIAHRLSTILSADQILVMDHGDIIEQGTHSSLMQKNGAYAKLYNSQFA